MPPEPSTQPYPLHLPSSLPYHPSVLQGSSKAHLNRRQLLYKDSATHSFDLPAVRELPGLALWRDPVRGLYALGDFLDDPPLHVNRAD
jgi:hypothetical protein